MHQPRPLPKGQILYVPAPYIGIDNPMAWRIWPSIAVACRRGSCCHTQTETHKMGYIMGTAWHWSWLIFLDRRCQLRIPKYPNCFSFLITLIHISNHRYNQGIIASWKAYCRLLYYHGLLTWFESHPTPESRVTLPPLPVDKKLFSIIQIFSLEFKRFCKHPPRYNLSLLGDGTFAFTRSTRVLPTRQRDPTINWTKESIRVQLRAMSSITFLDQQDLQHYEVILEEYTPIKSIPPLKLIFHQIRGHLWHPRWLGTSPNGYHRGSQPGIRGSPALSHSGHPNTAPQEQTASLWTGRSDYITPERIPQIFILSSDYLNILPSPSSQFTRLIFTGLTWYFFLWRGTTPSSGDSTGLSNPWAVSCPVSYVQDQIPPGIEQLQKKNLDITLSTQVGR